MDDAENRQTDNEQPEPDIEPASRPADMHQREDRVQGHILVYFLAYVLSKTLAEWMRPSGLDDAPRTVVSEFAKIQSGDVVFPARTPDGTTRDVRLRCVTRPDPSQKVLLDRLGLKFPSRLRPLEAPRPM